MALLGNLKGSAQAFQDTEPFYNGIVTQSLRFPNDNRTMTRAYGTGATSNTTMSFGGWLKLSRGAYASTFSATLGGSGVPQAYFAIDTGEKLLLRSYTGSADVFNYVTTQVFRDQSAWYHFWFQIDTTDSTASDRVKIYVNGVRVTDFSTETNPSSSATVIGFNQNYTHYFGHSNGTYGIQGYLADWWFLDGQDVSPVDTVGEFKNGIFIPKEYSSPTFGNKGWHLEFKQTGTSADASGIGADTSGNNNHWTVSSEFGAEDSAFVDSPENNFSTMNNLINGYGTNLTMTEGCLKASSTDGEYNNTFGTILMQSGKWYWEITSDNFNNYAMYGVAIENAIQTADSTPYGQTGVYAYATHGEVYNETASSSGSYTSFLNQEIIGIAVDLDASPRTFKFYNNNTLQGTTNLSTNFNVDLLPIFVLGGAQNVFVNFGQDSSFAGQKTAQGNTDGNGIGDFYYAPPSGHLALCSANLPEPNIGPHSSTQADDHFNTVLWSGNSSTQAITGLGFQPDWVWGKTRSGAYGHGLYDTSRGISNVLSAESSNAESSYASFSSFDSDGFTLGGNALLNESGKTYVAWNWKANGGTTSSNSDGTTTSTVQANTTAGFSIITYTGNATAGATIGHGLGKAPKWVITKARSGSYSWLVGHDGLASDPWTDAVLLDTTDAVSDSNLFWNDTAPNSSVITLGGAYNPVNGNNVTYVMYAFAEIEGYSKFGSYTGNGNADGTYVYTGFRPAWIMFKRTDSTNHWLMLDNKRNVNNPVHKFLLANATDAEDTSNDQDTDFTSNGFKVRNSNARNNASGGTYIYMAFAEAPFKYALAR